MKKIAVIGLGIIGGSLCASLTKAGYTVDGVDLDKNVMKIAKEKGYICGFAEEISAYDVVLIAVPPKATVALLENTKFKENALVSPPFVGQILRIPDTRGNAYTAKAGETKTLLCGNEEGYERKNGTDILYIGMRVIL